MTRVHAIDRTTTETIRRKLEAVERDHGVRVLFAVESGSRAWGFPSPDSDYDVRFVYLHPRDWYLSLVERRDVIEIPIDAEDHDISGWDVRKALQLLLRSNPPLYEWLGSPIVYREDGATMAGLRSLAERGYANKTMGWHYLRMADRMPPMNLGVLLDGITLPADVRRAADRLLEQKTRTSELGKGRRVRALDRWIERELGRGEERCGARAAKTSVHAEAEAYFRQILDGVGDG